MMIRREPIRFQVEDFKEVLKNYLHDRIVERCHAEGITLNCNIEEYATEKLEALLDRRVTEEVTLEELWIYTKKLNLKEATI